MCAGSVLAKELLQDENARFRQTTELGNGHYVCREHDAF